MRPVGVGGGSDRGQVRLRLLSWSLRRLCNTGKDAPARSGPHTKHMTAVLYISTGIALYGAAQALQRATRMPGMAPVHILYALLCLSVAGFACTSAWVQSFPPAYMSQLGRAVVAFGLSSWLVLTWLVVARFRPPRLGVPIGLSVVWAGLLLLNLALPVSLAYFDAFRPGLPTLDPLARLSQGWLLVHAAILATWCHALWRTRQGAPSTPPGTLAGWWVGLLLLGAATGLDLLVYAGLLSSVYLSPFAWTLLLILGVGLTRGSAVAGGGGNAGSGAVPADIGAGVPVAAVATAMPSGQSRLGPLSLAATDPNASLHFHWHLDQSGRLEPSPVQGSEEDSLELSGRPLELSQVSAEPAVAPIAAPAAAAHGESAPPPALAADLAAIVQFTRIALRRIERGKTDAGKIAVLFRAIQQKAETARDALAAEPASDGIPALVARVLAQEDAEREANGIRIVQRLARNLPATAVAPALVEEVLLELLREAIDATLAVAHDARKPIVLIARATRDGGIELSVSDGGADVSLAEIRGTFETLLTGGDVVDKVPLIAAAERIAARGGRLWCAPNPAGGSIRYLRLPGHMP